MALAHSTLLPLARRRARRRAIPSIVRPAALIAGGDAAALLAGAGLSGFGPGSVAFAVAGVLALAALGHHRLRIVPSMAQEAGPIVARLAAALVLVGLFATPGRDVVVLLKSGSAAILLVLVVRSALYGLLRSLRARRLLVERAVVVGAGQVGVDLANALLEHPEYGLEPVGFVDDVSGESLPLPMLADPNDLTGVLDEHRVRRVIVAFGVAREPDLVSVIRACDDASVEIHVLPRFFELAAVPPCLDTDNLWGIPLIRLRRSLIHRSCRRAKRVFDVVVAAALLVLTAPVCAVIHLLVRLSSPGPVLFRQRRVGEDGQEIEVLKFRSLRMNDDSDTQWCVSEDDRRTPIGAVLRKTSLDELPQLLNVLRGDMSLVGPRPERPHFVQRFSDEVPGYPDRHRAPAGMTGWAQVHGLRGDTSIEDRARFDNQYIEYWSLWNDIVILARTAREMVAGGERDAA
ncbi:MAG TPA: exopolysaccharide biosynthesis polyprenyl glycosylphosphotransferase [Acidimicrobiales bacterium]|nr:exopolysaccharide biosynthesis polyprenyl glycosylphosphotransferase [Acidimicrobiales bacterium]